MSGFGERTRRGAAIVAVVVTGVASVAGPAPAAGAAGPPEQVLERAARGEDAIRALGDRLPEVAARNGRTPAELRSDLRADDMLWVDPTGQLLFVDEFADHGDVEHADATGAGPEAAVAPLADTFALHSWPGSDRVVFLDFDGHDATGTAWDGRGETAVAAPYDSDGDPTTFSDAERSEIQAVWARVAEDFAPFDVDVTTEDPGTDAIRRDSTGDTTYGTRLVVTPTQTYDCSCGGVAFVGVFDAVGAEHDLYQPAWVFTSGVGTGAKYVAEAASHEIGHNLGLSHDGGSGTGYYEGHGDWAPIMGVGYYRPITQWSKGEYAGATEKEDDIAVMESHGAPLAGDDHGESAGSATPLGDGGSGVIGSAGDVDAFGVTVAEAGTLTIAAAAAAISPNLDIHLRVVSGDGTTLASVDPPSTDSTGHDTSIGLGADVALPVGPGTYTVLVDGAGFGDPASDGYSDYGSLGSYTVASSFAADAGDPPPDEPPDEPATPPSAPADLSGTPQDGGVALSWTDTSDDETGFEVEREFQHKNGRWQGTTVLTAGADATGMFDATGTGTFRYRVRAVNAAGASSYTGWAVVEVTGGSGGDSGGDSGGGNGGGNGGGKGGGKPDKTR